MEGEKNATAAPPEGTCVVCGKTEAPGAPVQWADQTRRLCEGCVDGELERRAEARKAKRGKAPKQPKAGAAQATATETTGETTIDPNPENKETDMAKAKKTPKTKAERKPKAAKEPKPERKRLGEVALVMRVPKEAVEYIDAAADGRARTVWLREVLAKGDAKLGKILEPA